MGYLTVANLIFHSHVFCMLGSVCSSVTLWTTCHPCGWRKEISNLVALVPHVQSSQHSKVRTNWFVCLKIRKELWTFCYFDYSNCIHSERPCGIALYIFLFFFLFFYYSSWVQLKGIHMFLQAPFSSLLNINKVTMPSIGEHPSIVSSSWRLSLHHCLQHSLLLIIV